MKRGMMGRLAALLLAALLGAGWLALPAAALQPEPPEAQSGPPPVEPLEESTGEVPLEATRQDPEAAPASHWGDETQQGVGPPPAAAAEEEPPTEQRTQVSGATFNTDDLYVLGEGDSLAELAAAFAPVYVWTGRFSAVIMPVEWQTDEAELDDDTLAVLQTGGMITVWGRVLLPETHYYMEDGVETDLYIGQKVWVHRQGGPERKLVDFRIYPLYEEAERLIPLGCDEATLRETLVLDRELVVHAWDEDGAIISLPVTNDWSKVDTSKPGFVPIEFELPPGLTYDRNSPMLTESLAFCVVDPDIIDLTYFTFNESGPLLKCFWLKNVAGAEVWMAREDEKGEPGDWWHETECASLRRIGLNIYLYNGITINLAPPSPSTFSVSPFWAENGAGEYELQTGVYYLQVRSDDGDSEVYSITISEFGPPVVQVAGGDTDGGDTGEQKPPVLQQPAPGSSTPGDGEDDSDSDSSSASAGETGGSSGASGSGSGSASQSGSGASQSGPASGSNTGGGSGGNSAGPAGPGGSLEDQDVSAPWWESSSGDGDSTPLALGGQALSQDGETLSGQNGTPGYGYSYGQEAAAQRDSFGSGAPPVASPAVGADEAGQPMEQVTETTTAVSGLRLREMMALQPAGVLFQKSNLSLWLDCDFLTALSLGDDEILTVRLEADPDREFSISAAVNGQPLADLPGARAALYSLPAGRGALTITGPDGTALSGLAFDEAGGEVHFAVHQAGIYTLAYEREPVVALAAQTVLPQRAQGGPATALLAGGVTLLAAGAAGVFLLRGRLSALLKRMK